MSSITRMLIGEMSLKSKGKSYINEMIKKLSPESIAKKKTETQPIK